MQRRHLPPSVRQSHYLLPQGAHDGKEEDATDDHDLNHTYSTVSTFTFLIGAHATYVRIYGLY